MPTKRLPSKPDINHRKHQAKDLLHAHRSGQLDAYQRIREFHPRFQRASDTEINEGKLTLADAYLAIAREYGFSSWARLRGFVEKSDRGRAQDLSTSRSNRGCSS